jgi:hypothetical protein
MKQKSKSMPKFICTTCGTQYPDADEKPSECLICSEERQYVGWNGQEWTTLEKLRADHKNSFKETGVDLYSITTEPEFGIGQRAFLLKTPNGNVLWDCLSLLDGATKRVIDELGGLELIAISHPHYYTSMIEWCEAFDAPVYIQELDQQWVVNPSPRVSFWKGESMTPIEGITLVNLGGHFEGGTVLYQNARKRLLSGDIIVVAQDRRWASFMYSYPNMIPLSKSKILQIKERVSKFRFDSLYSAFECYEITSDADKAVERSADRYIHRISD